jgi:hypothetical protein
MCTDHTARLTCCQTNYIVLSEPITSKRLQEKLGFPRPVVCVFFFVFFCFCVLKPPYICMGFDKWIQ